MTLAEIVAQVMESGIKDADDIETGSLKDPVNDANTGTEDNSFSFAPLQIPSGSMKRSISEPLMLKSSSTSPVRNRKFTSSKTSYSRKRESVSPSRMCPRKAHTIEEAVAGVLRNGSVLFLSCLIQCCAWDFLFNMGRLKNCAWHV
jgi:hypothetical protein